jgi:restriction system protein
MPVPDYQTLMLPVLKTFAAGEERRLGDAKEPLAREFRLSTDEIAERLPKANQTRFYNRTGWAHNYLKQAGLLESPRRGVYRITQRGRDVLKEPPAHIDVAFLGQFPEFSERGQNRSNTATGVPANSEAASSRGASTAAEGTALTPDEQIRLGYLQLRASLAAQLLERIKQASPEFFENLVVEVLVAMGYGGSHEDAAKVVGRSGDGGIDGIIKQDRLGLENIYVQAKRWEATVGRPTIQQFAGALQGQRARKGVLITTSEFSRDAVEYAAGLQNTIVLVSGAQLADLMIDYGVGVSEGETLKLKKLDEDYFGDGLE